MMKLSQLIHMVWTVLLTTLLMVKHCQANHDARRLYDFLLAKGRYNKLVRPVEFNNQKVDVNMGLKLSQLIKVDEKNQIITMNMFITQKWRDYSLQWDPGEYGGVMTLTIPSQVIWLRDIVLYNNGDGDYNVTELTMAVLSYDGMVFWEPPVIVKSYCDINVKYFPFDEQTCHLKFGTWSYNYDLIDLNHIWAKRYGPEETVLIEVGIDTDEYYPSKEWDLMSAPARKHIVHYPCCPESYPDISFNFTIRRKTKHYAINLIMPTIFINFLTVLAFYLPSDCGEKISLCISILLSLTIFQLLLMDLIPPTSFTLPLMGEYLLCTLFLVTISVFLSVVILSANCRSSSTHTMPGCIKHAFLTVLPPLLLMRRPTEGGDQDRKTGFDWSATDQHSDLSNYGNPYKKTLRPMVQDTGEASTRQAAYTVSSSFVGLDKIDVSSFCNACAQRSNRNPSSAQKAIEGVAFIAKHLYDDDATRRTRADWRFLALVVDRLLLWTYATVTLVGGLSIMLNAPVLYDYDRVPLNKMPPEVW